MAQMINFLPWRERRRRQQWRLGILYLAGLLLAFSAITLANQITRQRDEALIRAKKVAENQLYTQLQQREGVLREQQQQRDKRRLRQQKRALTKAWQPRLQAIADFMPQQAWLTRLEYQPGGLTISGQTFNLQALAELEQVLNKVTGFQPATAGDMRRNAQGIWLFSFSLAGEQTHAAIF